MTLRRRLLWLFRWVRTPYAVYENVQMNDGRWYAVRVPFSHECCMCGSRHLVLVYWHQEKQQLFWNWTKEN